MTYVRSFQLSDYASVTGLFHEVLSDSCYEETMEAFGRQLSWDSELVLVAESQQQIVGVIIGTIDNNNGYYYRIAVIGSQRRKGIGRALIQGLQKKFNQRKVKKVLVNVDHHNEPILPFYESLGYRAADFLRAAGQLSIVNG